MPKKKVDPITGKASVAPNAIARSTFYQRKTRIRRALGLFSSYSAPSITTENTNTLLVATQTQVQSQTSYPNSSRLPNENTNLEQKQTDINPEELRLIAEAFSLEQSSNYGETPLMN